MKKIIAITLGIAIFSACNTTNNQGDSLVQLTQEKDSILLLKSQLTARVTEIDMQLEDLDSTKKFSVVTVIEASPTKFERFFTVHGVLETDQNAVITAQSMGKIESIRVKEGQQVSKGQVLALINADVLKKQIAELENRMELAQTVYERQEKLWKQNIGSEIQYLQAKNDRDAFKKSLQLLNEQYELTVVKAPFSGKIDEILPKEGETVSMGSPIFRLINLSEVYIKADVAENNLNSIHIGDTVFVTFPSYNQRKVQSVVSRIGDFINPNNRTFKIRVNVPNPDLSLKPNMLAELHIRDFVLDSVITIPENVIIDGADNMKYVFVANQNDDEFATVVKKDVTIESTYKKIAAISQGLNGGDRVVYKGARSIQDGQRVRITEDFNN